MSSAAHLTCPDLGSPGRRVPLVRREIVLVQHRAIVLVHHTDYGMLTSADEDSCSAMEADVGERPAWSSEALPDLEEDVRNSLRRILDSPFAPGEGGAGSGPGSSLRASAPGRHAA